MINIFKSKKSAGSGKGQKTGGSQEKWVRLVMEESGLSREEVLKRMDEAKKTFGVKASLFHKKKMWDMTPAQIARKVLHENRKEEERNAVYEDIEKNIGKSREQVKDDLKTIRSHELNFIPTTEWYYRYGIWSHMEELDRVLDDMCRLRSLRDEAREKLKLADQGEIALSDLDSRIQEYYDITRKYISDLKIRYFCEKLKDSRPEIMESEEAQKEAAVDMLCTMELLEFYESEYVSFELLGKSIEEKRTYITSVERAKLVRLISSKEAIELMNDKYESYLRLKKYYGREIIQVEGEEDFGRFEDFCSRHQTFVKKNGFDSLGRGIFKVEIEEDTDLRELYTRLTDDIGPVVLEELIQPSEFIRNLNPDSVNTVRIIVFMDEGEAKVFQCFMKIGRKGSFVDNGGAGGMFVHIDPDTGIYDSDAIIENGQRFETHPDHGYDFRGIVLPDWEEAKKTAKDAIREIEGLGFIGWDLTYTKDHQWIIIEGNSMSQFIAQQGTVRRGLKDEIYKEMKFEKRLEEGKE